MRRPWFVVAASVLGVLLAPHAVGQGETPVEAAGDFNSAPVVEPGLYRDVIQVGETLFLGVELEHGQRLLATVTVAGGSSPSDSAQTVPLQVRVHTPDRGSPSLALAVSSFGGGERTVSVEAGPVGGALRFDDPGTHHLVVALGDSEQRSDLRGRDFPVTFDLVVEQVLEPTTTTSTTTTSTTTTTVPTTTVAEGAAAADGDGDGGSGGGAGTPVAVGVAFAALVIGVVGGRAAAARR